MDNREAKTGQWGTRKVVSGGTRKLVKGEAKTGHPIDLQALIYHQDDLKEDDLQHGSRRVRQHPRGVTRFSFDSEDLTKFKAIPCRKPADHAYLLKVLAMSQATIPPWAVWDALEAVKQIGPKVPIAYFRVVLADNCAKVQININKAIRAVRLPKTLPSCKGFPIPATIGRTIPQDPPRPTQESLLRQIAVIYHAERKRQP